MFSKNNLRICIYLSILILSLSYNQEGFYEPSDGITLLTASNFNSTILNSSDVWVVEYFAAWCPYCQDFVTEMKALAGIQDKFKVAAIDADKNTEIGKRYHITRYPTVKIFGTNKELGPINYSGKKSAIDIANAAERIASEIY